jgi:hypothetical protein
MKILVEHDYEGLIKAIGIPLSKSIDSGSATLVPRPGHQVTEVEASHVKSENDYDQLRQIKGKYRVEAHPSGHRLVSKKT